MTIVRITSSHYPAPPQIPGLIKPFGLNSPVDLNAAELELLLSTFESFPERVRSRYKIFQQPSSSKATGGTPNSTVNLIASQPQPTKAEAEAISSGGEEIPLGGSDLTQLTDDDLDLVNIEVSKVLGKTVVEARPIIEATASNEALPLLLRTTYLGQLVVHPDVQKSLKSEAAEHLDVLNGNAS